MDDNTLLIKVKEQLGVTSEDPVVNANIGTKIIGVKNYLINAGAKHMETAMNDIDVTCIAIGVNDLLNSKAGETKFSPAFDILALQTCRG